MAGYMRKLNPAATNSPEQFTPADMVTLHASAARTATGQGPAIPAAGGVLRLTSTVSAVSGTSPSLTVTVETSADGSTGWTAVPAIGSAMPAQTAAGSARRVYAGLDRFVRVVYTITGTTPSITFAATGEIV